MATQFKRVRSVTLPVLKVAKGQPRFFYFKGPMYLGEKIDPKKDAATLAHCVDMETGEEGLVICTAVMRKELERNYPGDGYVGRGFELSLTMVPEKKYNIPSIAEVAVPDEILAKLREAAEAAQTADSSTPAGKSKK